MSGHQALPRLLISAAALISACSGGGGGEGFDVIHTITIQPSAAALCVGDSLLLTATARNSAGDRLTGVMVHWISSAPEAVTVDSTGLVRALKNGATAITASAQGVTSSGAEVEVPTDLVPEFVPDSAVLAPGDTMTFGVRLRRLSGGLAPQHPPVFTPFDSAVASLSATGLLTAKSMQGRVSPTLTACGVTGGGAMDVYTATATTGKGYLWLSGDQELRARLSGRLLNFARTGGDSAFQIYGWLGSGSPAPTQFAYEDTVALNSVGSFPLDSISTTEASLPNDPTCAPPRPFAVYGVASPQTVLVSLRSGSARITSFTQQGGYAAVSGRLSFRMRGLVAGGTTLDTLRAIYTFSAPLVDTTGRCP